MAKDHIHPVDLHVGQRLRLARLSRGLSQTELAKASGITFQQVQKYEKGTNRVSASRLFEFANVLGAEISYFFEGTSEGIPGFSRDGLTGTLDLKYVDLEILRVLGELKDTKLKRRLLDVISALPGGRNPRASDGESAGKRRAAD